MCSEKTLYNYGDGCLFDIRNIDLLGKVKYFSRYKKLELKVDRSCRVGRNYHDYEVYMEKYPDTAVVQMDSVIGCRGGKVLLAIFFVNVSLMLGFLREANTSKSVIDILLQSQCAVPESGDRDKSRIHPQNRAQGESFDELTQEGVDVMVDRINSYRRKKLNGRNPYETFCFYYGEVLAQKLGCHEVPAKDINLTPGLLKK